MPIISVHDALVAITLAAFAAHFYNKLNVMAASASVSITAFNTYRGCMNAVRGGK
jgi:hypothetical protein